MATGEYFLNLMKVEFFGLYTMSSSLDTHFFCGLMFLSESFGDTILFEALRLSHDKRLLHFFGSNSNLLA